MKAIIFDFNRTLFDPEENKLFSETIPLLEELKSRRVPLALITKKSKSRISEVKEIANFFSFIYFVSKKETQQFANIADQLSLPYSEIIVVGDSIEEEIRCGNQLGMITVRFKGGKFCSQEPKYNEEKPDFVCSSLIEITTFLNERILNQDKENENTIS
jgi:FMN phosphatase YigB (HAD superfamily)